MRKLGVAVPLLLCFTFCTAQSPRHDASKAQPDQHKEDAAKEGKAKDGALAGPVTQVGPVTIANWPKNELQTPPWWEPWWNAVVSNWPLIIIGIGGTVAALCTLIVIGRQTEVLINSERAWILVTVQQPTNRGGYYTQGDIETFAYSIANRGKTVARLTGPYRANFAFLSASEKLPDIPDYGIHPDAFPEHELPMLGSVLAPKESSDTLREPCALKFSPKLIFGIENHTHTLYFLASLKYFDFANKERELRFCYQYWPTDGQSSARWQLGGPKGYNSHT